MEQNRAATARAGLYAVGSIVSEELRWIFREQPVEDYGIDAHLEICRGGTPTGRLLAAQIKSGKSWFERRTKEGFLYTGSLRHLEYWTSYSVPVLLILYHPEEKKALWVPVEERRIRRTERGWSIVVPYDAVLNRLAEEALQELARRGGSRQEKCWKTLAGFSREQISAFGEDRILDLLSQAERSLDIAAPFLDEAFFWALKALSFRVPIRLLTGSGRTVRGYSGNGPGGAGIETRIFPGLHEKGYLLDGSFVVYGSACLTKPAWRDARELALSTDDPRLVALRLGQFERMWHAAVPGFPAG